MQIHSKLLGVQYGSIRKTRFFGWKLADVEADMPMRALGKGRIRPCADQSEGQYEVARLGSY